MLRLIDGSSFAAQRLEAFHHNPKAWKQQYQPWNNGDNKRYGKSNAFRQNVPSLVPCRGDRRMADVWSCPWQSRAHTARPCQIILVMTLAPGELADLAKEPKTRRLFDFSESTLSHMVDGRIRILYFNALATGS